MMAKEEQCFQHECDWVVVWAGPGCGNERLLHQRMDGLGIKYQSIHVTIQKGGVHRVDLYVPRGDSTWVIRKINSVAGKRLGWKAAAHRPYHERV